MNKLHSEWVWILSKQKNLHMFQVLIFLRKQLQDEYESGSIIMWIFSNLFKFIVFFGETVKIDCVYS